MMLDSIKTGFFLYDGGALFGVAPKLLWNKEYPADENNLCRLTMRSLLLKTADRLILFDDGIGTKQAEIMEEYGYSDLKFFDELLEPYGYKREDVTDVVLSTLHFNHCGGTTFVNFDQNIELTFPNATVYAGDTQWQTMLNPHERERYMFFTADVMEALKQDKIHPVKENFRLCDEVEIRVVDGHTTGQLVSYITVDGQTYVMAGGLVPTSANVHIDWMDSHDMEPNKAFEAKQALLDEAVEKRQWIVFPYDVNTPCAQITKNVDYEITATCSLNEK